MSRYYVDDAVTDDFAQKMVKLASAWDSRLSEERVRTYAQALNGVAEADVTKAFNRAIRECKWFPSVAELLSFIQPSADDAALLAWTRLNSAAASVGAWAPVEIDDSVAADALVAVFGSWAQFCEHEDGPALGAKRQEFMAAFRQLARMPRRRKATLLPGALGAPGSDVPTWRGRIRLLRDAGVEFVRASEELTDGDRRERARLPEAGAAQADQGATKAR